MVAHPRSAGGALCFILKFGYDRIYSFEDISIFIFWHFGLKLPIHAYFRGFWGIFSSNDVICRSSPQKALSCADTRRLSHKA